MAELDLPDDVLDELARRHVDFLVSRLTAPAARDDVARTLAEGWRWFLDRPVRSVVDAGALADAFARALPEEHVRRLYAPLVRDVARRALASARRADGPLGDHVPEAARRAIEELAEQPDLVPERLVREVLGQEAVETALRDVVFDGLREFHDTVNPFFADWGIPALVGWLPVGAGAVKASLGSMRAEFDKRLEPEMRKFLLGFSRRATRHLADEFLARSNDPALVALRRNVIAFLYTQSAAELLAGVGDDAAGLAESAAEEIAVRALASGRLRDAIRDGIEGFVAEHGEQSVGDWLSGTGANGEPDFEAWADLAWPALRDFLAGPVARALLERMTGEFYDGLRR